ncbi:TetR/AcrR family transcriptional regulator [Paraconexibacter sp. AEG42_29]|uniref:TetR/AcrR family transcriptional regulator n=1 Tax=Paraconexibacter sp. AEG42_29 TaxID=2997339 RepID=UPI00339D921C
MADTQNQGAPTRTDRRRERTRAKLTGATRELITEKGVAGLRISEITDRADVALGSFYNYFDSKEDIVDAVVEESLRELAEAVAHPATADQDPAELVSSAIRRFVHLAYEDPTFARLVVYLNHADSLFAVAVHPAARGAVEAGIASGRFRDDDVDVVVTGIVGGALALMRGIVDDRVGPGAQDKYAEVALRALGVPLDEAAGIASRPLPVAP